ncbi:hypothetical protein RirG_266170 [Rhizophagus irregularis DAOM 197198w]|uniref:Uncharacterized protein n=1 Tax=Rhizophagus irregularis (strain DAOM 197198w) TaxID=1432141 RepID=A0A015IAU1_RHIIW|nr:hypothetical protein RirG_266170 [Rhizophagus irregularis DAOM 197198w]
MISRINDIIPICCTKQMRNNVFQKQFVTSQKSVLRMLYRDLTGDASLANDQISKEMEEILRLMMIKFDIFWNELDGYFNEHNNTVINERRADTSYGSFKYEIPRTTLPDDDAVPSEGWIRLNFA